MPDGKTIHMFYETKTHRNMQGDIGAAVSKDGGATFQHVGVVLDEPWHLSYPFVLEEGGQMYMIPEGSKSGQLRLYRAQSFPTKWILDQVLIEEPIIDASLVKWGGKWWMFASNRNVKTSKGCRELEIWYSDSLKGTWKPHPMNPVKQRVQGARCAGRPVVYRNQVYRFAQDCGYTYGHKVRAFQVGVLNTTHFMEREVPLNFQESKQGEGVAWNGVRYHHMDAHQLPSGNWIAAMDGDKYVSDYLTWDYVRRLAVLLPLAGAIAAVATTIYLFGGLSATLGAVGRSLRPAPPASLHRDGESSKSMSKRSAVWSSVGSSPLLRRRLVGPVTVQHCVLALGLLVLLVWVLPWFIWNFCRMPILSAIMYYVRHWSGPPDAIAVDGQFSKLSIMVMSYEARTVTLQAFVKHYSRCASVGEIIVVWNKGTPPDPARMDSAVPLRIRVEAKNSMNNRFRPDPEILNRAVLMLDDDIIMPCSDVERGFAKWRHHPERITGYYARILEGPIPQYLCIHGCEKYTFDLGLYNIILAGASFLDRELVFEAYYSEENTAGREYVDQVFNCDDLLLNYLMAHRLKGAQYVQYVRPTKRFDVGKLTSKRLSTGNFGPVRHRCTQDFAKMFGNPLKDRAYPLEYDGLGKPTCGPSWLGCLFV